jgi:hypothetical protein
MRSLIRALDLFYNTSYVAVGCRAHAYCIPNKHNYNSYIIVIKQNVTGNITCALHVIYMLVLISHSYEIAII